MSSCEYCTQMAPTSNNKLIQYSAGVSKVPRTLLEVAFIGHIYASIAVKGIPFVIHLPHPIQLSVTDA